MNLLLMFALSLQETPPAEEPGFFDDVGLKTRLRALGIDGERDAARYLEYRDFFEGGEVSSFELWLKPKEDAEAFFRGKVADAGQLDQKIELAWGLFGSFDMTLDWDKIPHRFGFNAKTRYGGRGHGLLFLDDSMQGILQGSGNAVAAANRLRAANVTAAHLDDLNDVMLERDRVNMGVNIYELEPLRIGVTFNYEARNGVRPIFGSFGFGNTVQLLEPIDYTTWGAGLSLTFAKDDYDVGLYYDYSNFQNHDTSLTWDNPFRISDSTTATAYSASFAAGPRTGRMALDADNEMHRLSVRGGADLWEDGRLTGEATWSWRSSLTRLLPYTTNLAIVPGAANSPPFIAAHASNLPDSTYLGEAFARFYQLTLTARPHDLLDSKVYGRYRSYDDQREDIEFPGYARTDAVWESDVEFERFDRRQMTLGTDWTWRIPDINSKLKPTYRFDRWDREARQVAAVIEHTGALALDTEWCPEVTTDLSFARGWRDGGSYDTLHAAELSLLRMYDQSDRVRDDYGAGLRVTPIEELDLGLTVRRVEEHFTADYGLERTGLSGAIFDVTARPCEALTTSLVLGVDRYESEQADRQWSPLGLGDPALFPGGSLNDGFETVKSDIYTLAFRAKCEAIKDEFDVAFGYTYAWNRSVIDIDSPLGTPANDSNAFIPRDLNDAEDSDRHSFVLDFSYRLSDEATFIWGYNLEIYRSRNFYNDGMTAVPVTPTGAYAGAYLLGLTYEDYEVHTFYFGVDLEF